jgi:hypothetical protein
MSYQHCQLSVVTAMSGVLSRVPDAESVVSNPVVAVSLLDATVAGDDCLVMVSVVDVTAAVGDTHDVVADDAKILDIVVARDDAAKVVFEVSFDVVVFGSVVPWDVTVDSVVLGVVPDSATVVSHVAFCSNVTAVVCDIVVPGAAVVI